MKQLFSLLILFMSVSTCAAGNPNIVMETSKGQIILELYPQQAPKTVANFLAYIKKDGFKQSIFHRVIDGFMIQGGGENRLGQRLDTLPAITNESKNGLTNQRGTIAMARTADPHSATRQFFINQKDNYFLDAQDARWGYAVFGRVTSGMQVVDEIAGVPTGRADRPLQTITIKSITLLDSK
jgi:peptidyl-prolyl cis-trans isomerase A (cyclophilin A)/peptidyl-prolyl cis-trans isomerase B (cyclophilin B)